MLSIATIPLAVANHLLAQESWAVDRLRSHAGKRVTIDIGILTLNWQVTADGLLQAGDDHTAASVTIRIAPSDLPLVLQDRSRAVSYAKVEGDAEFANAISHIAHHLKWEAEADLSRWVGDIAANRIVATARSAAATAGAMQRAAAENVADYLADENPMLVRPAAVADFSRDVIKLRDDVERLEKRIQKLLPG